MAATLRQAFPDRVDDVRLIKGSGGVFEIRNGQELLFSKRQQGRFPDEGEIERKLAS